MTGETHEPQEPAFSALRRIRAFIGLGPDPRLRRPEVPRLRPIRRGWALAVLQARTAVNARVSLADYLRARLARYETALQVPRTRLPLQIEVSGGEIRSALLPAPSAEAPESASASAAALEALDGPSAVREWAQVHARIAGFEEEAAAARRRAEEMEDRLSADVARGVVTAAPDDGIPPETIGRPPVRTPTLVSALTAVALAMVLAEAWAIAVPLLVLAGAYPPALSGPNALQSSFLLAFSLGASVGLLALASVAVGAAEGLARSASQHGRRRLASFAVVLGLVAAVTAARAASLAAPRSGIPPPSHAILLLALPAAAALAVRRAQREAAARAQERAAEAAWDHERAVELGERARRVEELAWAQSAADVAQTRLERARRRSRELAHRADDAARLLASAARQERKEQLRLAQSLLAALERDRYEYLRNAAARRTDEAAAGRPAPEEARSPADRRHASGRVAV